MINEILQKYGFRTKKSLGQNFLNQQAVLQQIADSGEITANDTVIEIGPGLGTLTELLCQQAKKVIAIEKDSTLLPILKDRLKNYSNLEIIEGDALEFLPQNSNLTNYKIIANIPYYITSPLINHFLKNQLLNQQPPPKLLVLLTQKEVAEKICAANHKMSVLALNVHTFATPSIIDNVPATAFTPAPKVDSAIIKIIIDPQAKAEIQNFDIYFQLIHAGFHQKRKTLKNALTNNLISVPGPKPLPRLDSTAIAKLLDCAKIDHNRRAESLTINEWNSLTLAADSYRS